MKKPKGYWTKETVQEEAKKYPHRNDFIENARGAYQAATKGGYLEDVCAHMEKPESKSKIWNEDAILREAQKYSDINHFKKDRNYLYRLAEKHEITDKITFHMEVKELEPNVVTLQHLSKVANQYNTRGDFAKNSPAEYRAAIRHEYLDTVCQHMLPKNFNRLKWTEENITQEASKYIAKFDFHTGSKSAYTRAKDLGIFENVCAHMSKPIIEQIPSASRDTAKNAIDGLISKKIDHRQLIENIKDIIQNAFTDAGKDVIVLDSGARMFLTQHLKSKSSNDQCRASENCSQEIIKERLSSWRNDHNVVTPEQRKSLKV